MTKRTPRDVSVATFACVAGFFHMRVFMAGATSTGASQASSVVLATSSAMPAAILAMRLAVHGTTRARSAHSESVMCGMEPSGYS